MSASFRLLAALALSAAAPASAQVGVTAGANFSTLDDARSADLDRSTGWHAGVFAQVRLATVGLRASVLYMDAGEVQTQPSGGVSSVALVSIPVDVQLRLPLTVAAVYVAAGPDVRLPFDLLVEDRAFDPRDVNLAASAAVGAELGHLFLELRYARDITGYARDLNIDPDLGTGTDYELSQFMLRAGVGL